MSLKEEVEKLIAQERHKLIEKDQKYVDFKDQLRARFTLIRGALEELVSAIESDYVEVKFKDSSFSIEIGLEPIKTYYWTIEPDHTYGLNTGYEVLPGFRIEESTFFNDPEGNEFPGTTIKFDSATKALEYIIKATAEKIAWCHHVIAKRPRK